MIDEDSLRKLQKRNAAILPQLDERQRRLFAASEARAAGHGGIAAVSRVTRIAASTIGRGLKELDAPPPLTCETSTFSTRISTANGTTQSPHQPQTSKQLIPDRPLAEATLSRATQGSKPAATAAAMPIRQATISRTLWPAAAAPAGLRRRREPAPPPRRTIPSASRRSPAPARRGRQRRGQHQRDDRQRQRRRRPASATAPRT